MATENKQLVLFVDFDDTLVQQFTNKPVYKNIESVLKKLRKEGVKIVVVTHNVVRNLIANFNVRLFDEILCTPELQRERVAYAMTLLQTRVKKGLITVAEAHRLKEGAAKGIQMMDYLSKHRIPRRNAAFVGDHHSDASAAHFAKIGFIPAYSFVPHPTNPRVVIKPFFGDKEFLKRFNPKFRERKMP